MKFDPDKHHRRSIRLRDYDYSLDGAYFVTICTLERKCLFGEVAYGEMRLNDIGMMVRDEWLRSVEIRNEIHLDAFVVMPNHVHGIVLIRHDVPLPVSKEGDRRSPLQQRGLCKRSLAAFVAGFKSACTRSVNEYFGTRGVPLWQRSYYEHVVRNDRTLHAIRDYIEANPSQWADDRENPEYNRTPLR